MLDRLIDLIINVIGWFKFWTVVRPYEAKAIYRMGKLRLPILYEGWYLLWPFNIEEVETIRLDKSSHYLVKQSAISKDGACVTLKSAVIWRVINVEIMAREIESAFDILATQCSITVAERIRESDWVDITTKKWHSDLSRSVTMKNKNYGIEVLEFEIIELVKTDASIRIFNE